VGNVGWYSVRCVFRLGDQPDCEERITLWRAASFNEAIELAEAEGQKYAASSGFEYLGCRKPSISKRTTFRVARRRFL
jgi:hypothetical protein